MEEPVSWPQLRVSTKLESTGLIDRIFPAEKTPLADQTASTRIVDFFCWIIFSGGKPNGSNPTSQTAFHSHK